MLFEFDRGQPTNARRLCGAHAATWAGEGMSARGTTMISLRLDGISRADEERLSPRNISLLFPSSVIILSGVKAHRRAL
jgi:hypothetical protein